MRSLHERVLVRVVDHQELAVWKPLHRRSGNVQQMILPRLGLLWTGTTTVRLVANLVIDIVEAVQLGEEFAEHGFLPRDQSRFVEGVVAVKRDVSDVVDVIVRVEGMQVPFPELRPVAIESIEEVELD